MGKDLLFSLILRPKGEPGFVLPLTLAFSVAVAGALEETFGFETGVKWPNDVYTRQGKIAGILAERAASGGAAFVIAGMGINVNSQKSDFPEEFRDRAVSCRSQGGSVADRAEVLNAVLVAVEKSYEKFKLKGFAAFRRAYLERLLISGWRVWFVRDKKRLAGTVEGVQEDGALLVRLGADEEPLALYNETVSIE
jgi:BirA family biotin operon repressor/biotin-[acetyl-CoA-carboxylase] ligase